jgi:hypothetical protein
LEESDGRTGLGNGAIFVIDLLLGRGDLTVLAKPLRLFSTFG